jgi:lysyl-tRNA synthetase class 2
MAAPDNPQYMDRFTRLEKWNALNVDPYGQRTDGLSPIEEARALHKGPEVTPHEGVDVVKVAGRIVLFRVMGSLIFLTVQDWTGRIQIGLQKKHFAETWPQAKLLELGDIAWFEGKVGHSNLKETTVWATAFGLLTKALLPPPDKFHGLSDTETRYRQRYIDLFANPDSLDVFLFRSKIIDSVRDFLKARRFIEVETPMMQAIPGGAAARPFVTHHNALDIDLFMRISPELYLKRLMVGGIERVFEINRNFRNEGIDTTHNPEFTMIEVYQAYSDLEGMMELTQSLVVRLAKERLAVLKKPTDGPLHLQFGERIIDYTPPFDRVSYAALFKEHVGVEMIDAEAVLRIAAQRGILHAASKEHDVIVGELFEQLAEPALETRDRPTFLYDYPAALCPLTKRKRDNPAIAERFELYVAGMELANAYTELNDPVVQEATFSKQLAGQKEEDSMARMDEDFIEALRYGMPPAGGLGIGIDRLVMLMTNRESIRDVVLFPLLKPQGGAVTEAQMEQDAEKIVQGMAKITAITDVDPIIFVLEKDGSLRLFDV